MGPGPNTRPLTPELLATDTIDLEGNELEVIGIGQAGTAHSTVLYARR